MEGFCYCSQGYLTAAVCEDIFLNMLNQLPILIIDVADIGFMIQGENITDAIHGFPETAGLA
mgnify:CR=1 FL=1